MKSFICVLKSSVTVKQRMCIRITSDCFIKRFKYERIVVDVSDFERYDSPVIQVENGTQVDFFDLCADIILEFRNICQPFLVWSVCMKIPVKNILGSYFRCGFDVIVSFSSAYRLQV